MRLHVPLAVQIPVQSAWVVTEQPPVAASQQEPVGWGHGLGLQDAPSAHVPEQFECVVTEQVPLMQHAPMGGTTRISRMPSSKLACDSTA